MRFDIYFCTVLRLYFDHLTVAYTSRLKLVWYGIPLRKLGRNWRCRVNQIIVRETTVVIYVSHYFYWVTGLYRDKGSKWVVTG